MSIILEPILSNLVVVINGRKKINVPANQLGFGGGLIGADKVI
jgi:hypothetical protein